ncbi:MAG: cyclic nucleotide-binding domain-containing protein [Thermodesulfobacteriota bacterium]
MAELEILEDASFLSPQEIQYLKEVFLFRGLCEKDIRSVMALARRVEVPRGHVLMKEGDPGEILYIIMKGEVEVSKNLTLPLVDSEASQPEKALVRLGDRDRAMFGELSLFDEKLRSATVRCLTDCSFYAMDRREFLEFCDTHVELGYRMFKNISFMVGERLRRASDDIVKLTTALTIALKRR